MSEKQKIFNVGDMVFFKKDIEGRACTVPYKGEQCTLTAHMIDEVREFKNHYEYRVAGYGSAVDAKRLVPASEWQSRIVEHLTDLLKTYKERIAIKGIDQ